MEWLNKITVWLQYLIAPLISYFKGWVDGKKSAEIKRLKEENEILKDGMDRYEKVIKKWNKIRADIRRINGMSGETGIDSLDKQGTVSPIRKLDN